MTVQGWVSAQWFDYIFTSEEASIDLGQID